MRYGTLRLYSTGEAVRVATRDDLEKSLEAALLNTAGTFSHPLYGKCYVDGEELEARDEWLSSRLPRRR